MAMNDLWMIFGTAALVITAVFGMSLVADVADTQQLRLGDVLNQLPVSAMLRDAEAIPGTDKALVLYILNPEIAPEYPLDMYALTCPGQVDGQPIEGTYHLALIEDGQVMNDVQIPGDSFAEHRSQRLRLVYQQLESILNGHRATAIERVEDGTAHLVKAKLLKLRDLNGDGRPHEFKLRAYLAGCGHVQGLIAGYSARRDRAIVYPILEEGKDAPDYWHDNFSPDETGTVHYRFACGDHGSPYGVRKMFEFDQDQVAYVLASRSETECDL